jgi:hypothetical protein
MVQVAPSTFQKIKLLVRGDMGRVYRAPEKNTDKLLSIKGMHVSSFLYRATLTFVHSVIKEGDDGT